MRWMWQALTFAMLLAVAAPMQASAQDADVPAFRKRAAEFFEAGQYSQALAVSEEWAQAAEKAESVKGQPGYATADALGNVAWYALFAKQPEKALAASGRATALCPDILWIETNRAHALLFLGRTKAAIAVYVYHKGEIAPDGEWEEVILRDFSEFRRRGRNNITFISVVKALRKLPVAPWRKGADDVAALNEQAARLYDEGKLVF